MQCLLDQTICHRRNTQESFSLAIGLRDRHLTYRLRLIPSGQQFLFDLRPVNFKMRAKIANRHRIDACRALVAHHTCIRTLQVLAFDHRFHQFHHHPLKAVLCVWPWRLKHPPSILADTVRYPQRGRQLLQTDLLLLLHTRKSSNLS
jgi:hypothetical protein